MSFYYLIISLNKQHLIDKIRELFSGHGNLIREFNTFLLSDGESYQIELTPEEESEAARTDPNEKQRRYTAVEYVSKVRDICGNLIFRDFLKLLSTYNEGKIGLKAVINQIALLFVDHSDLRKDFVYFLPDGVQDQARAHLECCIRETESPKRSNQELEALPHAELSSALMEETESVCERIHVSSHPVIAHKVNRLRDANTKPSEYRRLLKDVTLRIGHDATATLTNLEGKRVSVFAIDRSGLSMADVMLEIVPHANLHFLGKYLVNYVIK